MTCIRKTGSEWTMCRCEPCRADMARKSKRRRNGHAAVESDVRTEAWARVVAWVGAGYSATVIAGLSGVRRRAADSMVNDAKAGRNRSLHHATARRVMAAPQRPTEGGGWVPSVGTSRRLRALTVMGWSMRSLSERCDLHESTLAALRDPKHRTTRPKFAVVVARLYDELAMHQGPCRYAATRAARKGWAPPLAWDDIDDPNAEPLHMLAAESQGVDEAAVERRMDGDLVPITRAERWVCVERLHALGLSDRAIATRLHLPDRTILRDRQRLGLAANFHSGGEAVA